MAQNAPSTIAGQRDPGQRAGDAERRHRLLDAADAPQERRLPDRNARAGLRRRRDPAGRHARRPAPRRTAVRRTSSTASPSATSTTSPRRRITLRELIDSLADGTITLGDYFLLVLRSPTAQQGLAVGAAQSLRQRPPGLRHRRPDAPVPGDASTCSPARAGANGSAPVTSTSTLAERLPLRPRKLEARPAPGRLRRRVADRRSDRDRPRRRTAQADVDGRHRRRQRLRHLLHRAARPDPRPAGGLARRDAGRRHRRGRARREPDRQRHVPGERHACDGAADRHRRVPALVPDERRRRGLLPLRPGGEAASARASRSTSATCPPTTTSSSTARSRRSSGRRHRHARAARRAAADSTTAPT